MVIIKKRIGYNPQKKLKMTFITVSVTIGHTNTCEEDLPTGLN